MQEKKNIPQNLNPIQISTKINAPIDLVWDAITNPDVMRQWFVGVDRSEIQDGDTYKFIEMFGDEQLLHECLILEMDEPSRLRHTWSYPDLSQASSTVTWNLEKQGNQTEVLLTHEGIHRLTSDLPDLTDQRLMSFWDNALNQHLKKFLER